MYTKTLGGVQGPVGSAQSLASNAVIAQFVFDRPADVDQVQFVVKTALSSSGDTVVSFRKRLVVGSASGEVVVATINIPTGTAAGVVVYKRLNEVSFSTGQVLSVQVTTAATSAGDGYASFNAEFDPETPVNQAMLASS